MNLYASCTNIRYAWAALNIPEFLARTSAADGQEAREIFFLAHSSPFSANAPCHVQCHSRSYIQTWLQVS